MEISLSKSSAVQVATSGVYAAVDVGPSTGPKLGLESYVKAMESIQLIEEHQDKQHRMPMHLMSFTPHTPHMYPTCIPHARHTHIHPTCIPHAFLMHSTCIQPHMHPIPHAPHLQPACIPHAFFMHPTPRVTLTSLNFALSAWSPPQEWIPWLPCRRSGFSSLTGSDLRDGSQRLNLCAHMCLPAPT